MIGFLDHCCYCESGTEKALVLAPNLCYLLGSRLLLGYCRGLTNHFNIFVSMACFPVYFGRGVYRRFNKSFWAPMGFVSFRLSLTPT